MAEGMSTPRRWTLEGRRFLGVEYTAPGKDGPVLEPGERVEVVEASELDRVRAENDSKWIRAFNRLEKAVTRHMDAKEWTDDADDNLHHAWKQVMKDVSVDSRAALGGE